MTKPIKPEWEKEPWWMKEVSKWIVENLGIIESRDKAIVSDNLINLVDYLLSSQTRQYREWIDKVISLLTEEQKLALANWENKQGYGE